MAAEGWGTAARLRNRRREEPEAPTVQPAPAGFVLPPAKSLASRLFKEGYAFSFFQAVRVLEQLYPGRAPVGEDGPFSNEIIRFRAHPSLSFPPSQIYTIDAPKQLARPPEMEVTFMGLTGPSGILPRHYTELIMRLYREAKGPERTALRDWLDIFNHRFLSLFYRAWTKYRFYIPYQRREYEKSEPDTFTLALHCCIGMGLPHLRNRLRVAYWEDDNPDNPERELAGIDDMSLLYYGGLLGQRPRSAVALQALLEDYFRMPVQVEQFRGEWLQIDPDKQSRLGAIDGNNQLGVNTVVGERVWDILGRIQLRIGPLDYPQFTDFIPDRSATRERKAFFLLSHLVRLFVGPELAFTVKMVLHADAVPECQLVDDEESVGPRLGWNTWLKSQEAEFNAEDAVFEGEELYWINEDERMRALAVG